MSRLSVESRKNLGERVQKIQAIDPKLQSQLLVAEQRSTLRKQRLQLDHVTSATMPPLLGTH